MYVQPRDTRDDFQTCRPSPLFMAQNIRERSCSVAVILRSETKGARLTGETHRSPGAFPNAYRKTRETDGHNQHEPAW